MVNQWLWLWLKTEKIRKRSYWNLRCILLPHLGVPARRQRAAAAAGGGAITIANRPRIEKVAPGSLFVLLNVYKCSGHSRFRLCHLHRLRLAAWEGLVPSAPVTPVEVPQETVTHPRYPRDSCVIRYAGHWMKQPNAGSAVTARRLLLKAPQAPLSHTTSKLNTRLYGKLKAHLYSHSHVRLRSNQRSIRCLTPRL